MLLPFSLGHSLPTLHSIDLFANRPLDTKGLSMPVDDCRDELAAEPEPPRDPELDAAIKGKLLQEDRASVVSCGHVNRVPMRLYKSLGMHVKQKMHDLDKNSPEAELAARLKAFRLRVGLKQVAFSLRLGVSQQNVSSWEKGASCPSIESYAKLINLAAELRLNDDRAFFLSKIRDLLIGFGLDPADLRPGWDGRERRRAAGENVRVGKRNAGGGATS
jgi:DNA-binding transcriptional regulator YiaG